MRVPSDLLICEEQAEEPIAIQLDGLGIQRIGTGKAHDNERLTVRVSRALPTPTPRSGHRSRPRRLHPVVSRLPLTYTRQRSLNPRPLAGSRTSPARRKAGSFL